MNKDAIIKAFSLQPHPEGGYYREIFRSEASYPVKKGQKSVTRSGMTSIYFLLGSEDRSVFHRLTSDEIWYYHTGESATIYILHPDGKMEEARIGPNPEKGDALQVHIPPGCWFGAKVNTPDSFLLVSCAVAPGFDFEDFEMADRQYLLDRYPQHEAIIQQLT